MSSVFKMNLQGKPSMSYEEVVEKWHDRNTDKPAFQGNFLLAFVTSSNQIENIMSAITRLGNCLSRRK